jgi:transposase-like protein
MKTKSKFLSVKDTTISFLDFVKKFSTEHKALVYLENLRWENGIVCPFCGEKKVYKCNRKNEHGYYECSKCHKVFTVRTGTIFERSHIPLTKWLYACYKIITARKGISSVQLAVEIGVTQKTAWFMLQRIRESYSSNSFNLGKLQEIVEVDGAYFGGSEKCKHKSKKLNMGRGCIGKLCVLGMKQRKGKVKAVVIQKTDKDSVHKVLKEHIDSDATVMTDEASVYDNIGFKNHGVVTHSLLEFVKGEYSTNEIESVWAILKRGWKGVYHHMSPKHLQLYVNEFCFRLNDGKCGRHIDERIKSLCGFAFTASHMTYKQLLAKEGSNLLMKVA